MSEELKPCPFCGAQPKSIYEDIDRSSFSVECPNENCPVCPVMHIDNWQKTASDAAKAWNTRAPDHDAIRVATIDEIAEIFNWPSLQGYRQQILDLKSKKGGASGMIKINIQTIESIIKVFSEIVLNLKYEVGDGNGRFFAYSEEITASEKLLKELKHLIETKDL